MSIKKILYGVATVLAVVALGVAYFAVAKYAGTTTTAFTPATVTTFASPDADEEVYAPLPASSSSAPAERGGVPRRSWAWVPKSSNPRSLLWHGEKFVPSVTRGAYDGTPCARKGYVRIGNELYKCG